TGIMWRVAWLSPGGPPRSHSSRLPASVQPSGQGFATRPTSSSLKTAICHILNKAQGQVTIAPTSSIRNGDTPRQEPELEGSCYNGSSSRGPGDFGQRRRKYSTQ